MPSVLHDESIFPWSHRPVISGQGFQVLTVPPRLSSDAVCQTCFGPTPNSFESNLTIWWRLRLIADLPEPWGEGVADHEGEMLTIFGVTFIGIMLSPFHRPCLSSEILYPTLKTKSGDLKRHFYQPNEESCLSSLGLPKFGPWSSMGQKVGP